MTILSDKRKKPQLRDRERGERGELKREYIMP
jgi:hypothetical protein